MYVEYAEIFIQMQIMLDNFMFTRRPTEYRSRKLSAAERPVCVPYTGTVGRAIKKLCTKSDRLVVGSVHLRRPRQRKCFFGGIMCLKK